MQEDEDENERLNQRLRNLITFYHKDIVDDLDVRDVLPMLLSGLVLNHEDKQLIDGEVFKL